MATIHKLRPQTHEIAAEQLKLVLELPLGLKDETRQDLTEALSCYIPECWSYVMVGREASRRILEAIVSGSRPGVTLAVWEAARLCSAYGSGEIVASRTELARMAGTNETEVSRALSRLSEIGALARIGRGKYALHPQAAWAGSLRSREAAQTQLSLID
jgi:hypothetical protein